DRPARAPVAALPPHHRPQLDGDRDRERGSLRSGDPRQPEATLRFVAAHVVASLPLRDRPEERDRAQREPLIALPPRPGPRLPASDPFRLEARRHDPLSLAAGPPALREGAGKPPPEALARPVFRARKRGARKRVSQVLLRMRSVEGDRPAAGAG